MYQSTKPRDLMYLVDQAGRGEGRPARCEVCGDEGKLTKEHVFPHGAAKIPALRRYVDYRWWDRFVERGGKAAVLPQRILGGFWTRSLCGECNNEIGSRYANEYLAFLLDVLSCPRLFSKDPHLRLVRVRRERNTLLLAKQMASMILSVTPRLGESAPDLAAFVRVREALYRPPFKVLAFLVPDDPAAGTIAKFHGRVATFDPGWEFSGGEISSYPFGFVFTNEIGWRYRPDLMADVTGWFTGDGPELLSMGVHLTGVGSIQEGLMGLRRTKPQISLAGDL